MHFMFCNVVVHKKLGESREKNQKFFWWNLSTAHFPCTLSHYAQKCYKFMDLSVKFTARSPPPPPALLSNTWNCLFLLLFLLLWWVHKCQLFSVCTIQSHETWLHKTWFSVVLSPVYYFFGVLSLSESKRYFWNQIHMNSSRLWRW